LSIAIIKDYTKYNAYIVKQHNCLFNFGVTPQELEQFQNEQVRIEKEITIKRAKAKAVNPMNAMVEEYKKRIDQEIVKYNKEHLVPVEREDYITDTHIIDFVMEWYGNLSRKPWAVNKMAECANTIKYAILAFDKPKGKVFRQRQRERISEAMGNLYLS